jgi:hypothetical protein
VIEQLDGLRAHLTGLESVWEGGIRGAYTFYRGRSDPEIALAAALVETAADLQALGTGAPDPPHLLLGDLCLARASRLLAAYGDQRLQIGFARAVETVAANAATGGRAAALRGLLTAALELPS